MSYTSPSAQATEHLSGYQARDWDVVNYQMYQESRSGLWFRGPSPNLRVGEPYFVAIGAAQTFGCFCERPFPNLLESRLGLAAVNLGYGGAGPRFFDRHEELFELINGARFAIIQVMSARSEDNQLFKSGGLEYLVNREDGQRVSAANAYRKVLEKADAGLNSWPKPLRKGLRSFVGPPGVGALLSETRSNWVDSYRRLFSRIRVPTALLWFSQRSPGLHRGKFGVRWWWQRYDDVNAMFGDYPQLVTPKMLGAIRPLATRYVDCTSRRGMPQRLRSRFTGKLIEVDYAKDRSDLAEVSTTNAYYPSPEMHQDAARALAGPCREVLRGL